MTESGTSMHYDKASGDDDQNKNSMKNKATGSDKCLQMGIQYPPEKYQIHPKDATDSHNTAESVLGRNEDETVEVNMEAAVTADDVLRAGGFGARDDIGSFLPAALDSTDFEASLRDARDFEEPQGEMSRPGLGWTGSMDKNQA